MKNIKSILCASLLTLALTSAAFGKAGDITGKASAGDITGKASAGDITGKASTGDITGLLYVDVTGLFISLIS
jgi:hypothetical protein